MKNRLLIAVPILAIVVLVVRDIITYDDFSRERLNDGIQVGAPDEWRWARDGLQKKSVLELAGAPDRKQGHVWEYDSNIKGAYHIFYFNDVGFLSGCGWYVEAQADESLNAPKVEISTNLRIDYPRCVPMSWSGESDNGYEVEVDIKHPAKWIHSSTYFTRNEMTVHQHTGANKGRWRVRKLSLKGYGPWSGYVNFECIR
ncbi:MAG: hypothetical protein K9M45_08315 [Kiritimatiellales bacterium]|nr:hypothetical protein [Kiritimatiellales bacterium]